jgi:hypothetical protein
VTTGSLDVRSFEWSPDSKRVIFTEDLPRRMMESDIWALDVESGQLTDLTPDNVSGTVMQSIHSAHVEDAMCTTYFYRSGLWGNLMVNWSDALSQARLPAGIVEQEQQDHRTCMRTRSTTALSRPGGLHEGWNQHVTDFVEPVRFYLRGHHFEQLTICRPHRGNRGRGCVRSPTA